MARDLRTSAESGGRCIFPSFVPAHYHPGRKLNGAPNPAGSSGSESGRIRPRRTTCHDEEGLHLKGLVVRPQSFSVVLFFPRLRLSSTRRSSLRMPAGVEPSPVKNPSEQSRDWENGPVDMFATSPPSRIRRCSAGDDFMHPRLPAAGILVSVSLYPSGAACQSPIREHNWPHRPLLLNFRVKAAVRSAWSGRPDTASSLIWDVHHCLGDSHWRHHRLTR
jgi:hypothetical protein